MSSISNGQVKFNFLVFDLGLFFIKIWLVALVGRLSGFRFRSWRPTYHETSLAVHARFDDRSADELQEERKEKKRSWSDTAHLVGQFTVPTSLRA